MLIRVTTLFLLFTFFSFAQNSAQLRDSIVKYKYSNPNLAVEFGIEYTLLTTNQSPNSEIQNVFAILGEILLDMGLFANSLNYLNSSIEIYRNLEKSERNFPNIDQPPWVILNVGSIYFNNGDYENATEKYKQAIDLFNSISNKEAQFLGLNTSNSNLALIQERKGNYDAAEKIYLDVYKRRLEKGKMEDVLYSIQELLHIKLQKGESISAENKLQEGIQIYNKAKENNQNPILDRNLGYVYFILGAHSQRKKQYEKAILYLNKAKEMFLDNFPAEVHPLGSRLAECYLALKELNKAESIAKKNLKIKDLNDVEKIFNYKVLEKIYQNKGLYSELLKVKDSLILISSGSSATKIFKTLNNLETQIQLANSAKELNESKIRYNTYLYILIIGAVTLLFSLMTIRINYNYQKEKGSRLEVEKKLISNELDQKNRELVSKSNFILQRNEYLKKIKTKLESSKQSSVGDLQSASYELNSVINSDKSYKDFDKMFVNVYPEFYTKLNKIAELSTTDLRLASYIKMNHTNSEIAIISGVSSRTIESQRYRLSKKLNLEKDQSLNSFLLSI